MRQESKEIFLNSRWPVHPANPSNITVKRLSLRICKEKSGLVNTLGLEDAYIVNMAPAATPSIKLNQVPLMLSANKNPPPAPAAVISISEMLSPHVPSPQ